MGYRVALVYNLKKEKDESLPVDFYSEFDSEKTVLSIARALQNGGNDVVLVEAGKNLLSRLSSEGKFDIAFNIAEGVFGRSRESQVPAILEFLGIPCTGSGALTLALALDKAVAKKIFTYEGIPTPKFQLFKNPNDRLKSSMDFPLIVKPNREGSAKGISTSSVVSDVRRLYEEVEKTYQIYNQEVLVEEFIQGKELTVGILGSGKLKVLPILEIDFSSCKQSGEYFYSWRMKEYQGNSQEHLDPEFFCPARLDELTKRRVEDIALRAHKVLGCADFSRTDIRLTAGGEAYVLEVNPLPGLDPDESNFTLMAKSAGISFDRLINSILNSAIERLAVGQEGRYKNCQTMPIATSSCGET